MGCEKLQYESKLTLHIGGKSGVDTSLNLSRLSQKSRVNTGYYYYGARYYNPRISNWLSVDPIALYDPVNETEHYLDGEHNGGYYNPKNMSVYGYCYQNPVIWIDPNGKQALTGHGPSANNAAKDFGSKFNDNSIRANREMGAYIYSQPTKDGGKTYGYTLPVTGSESGLSNSDMDKTKQSLPNNTTIEAYIHTHAASTTNAEISFDDENFSPGDKGFAKNNKIDAFVTTPGGTLQKFDIISEMITKISSNMPKDTGPGTGVPGTSPASTSKYNVKPGDTVSNIAQRFGTTTKEVSAQNNLSNPDKIKSGQTLNITN
jgi:RHS repeat-associated protein